jgi:hypothetical protein
MAVAVVETHMGDAPDPENVDWNDPDACPFCGAQLPDGGAGFVDHADANPDCQARFEEWRENVAGDIGGEWSG